jgi:nitroimidazol reductase NimA-like FMN-containing flavoprotein (pyridoxamine 5'-phosphate oxidase superfamily)
MLKNALSQDEINKLLEETETGNLATIGQDGPYVIPINFVLLDGKIYLHGRKAGGQKLDNIRADDRICFEVFKAEGYRTGDTACKTGTIFQSAVGRGRARILEDGNPLIETSLLKFAEKYASHLKNPFIPEDKMALTAVIELSFDSWTGKFGK